MPAKSRREMIEDMLKETPNDAELRYMLAMEFVSGGDDMAAVRCFLEMLAVAPNYPPAYHQAGRALQRLNRIVEARTILVAGHPHRSETRRPSCRGGDERIAAIARVMTELEKNQTLTCSSRARLLI